MVPTLFFYHCAFLYGNFAVHEEAHFHFFLFSESRPLVLKSLILSLSNLRHFLKLYICFSAFQIFFFFTFISDRNCGSREPLLPKCRQFCQPFTFYSTVSKVPSPALLRNTPTREKCESAFSHLVNIIGGNFLWLEEACNWACLFSVTTIFYTTLIIIILLFLLPLPASTACNFYRLRSHSITPALESPSPLSPPAFPSSSNVP